MKQTLDSMAQFINSGAQIATGKAGAKQGRVSGNAIVESSVVLTGVPLTTWSSMKKRFQDPEFKTQAELAVSTHGKGDKTEHIFKTLFGRHR